MDAYKGCTVALTALGTGFASLLVCLPASAAAAVSLIGVEDTDNGRVSDTRIAGRVVARRDVDGDRRRDTIRYKAIRDDLVKVTVTTAAGRVGVKRLRTEYWPRGRFHGAAPMDGRAGSELVIGTTFGAHTAWFTVLTWRGGDLVRQGAPGRGHEWAVDAAATVYLGWRRTTSEGRARITKRYVFREGVGHHWTGRATTYVWRPGQGWDRASARLISIHGDRKASRIGGWRVKGLKRYPW